MWARYSAARFTYVSPGVHSGRPGMLLAAILARRARGPSWSGTADRGPSGSSRRDAVAQGSSGAPTRSRTWDLAVRSGALCPAELWGHGRAVATVNGVHGRPVLFCAVGEKRKPPWSVPRRAAPWTGPLNRSRRGARAARSASTRVRHVRSSARCAHIVPTARRSRQSNFLGHFALPCGRGTRVREVRQDGRPWTRESSSASPGKPHRMFQLTWRSWYQAHRVRVRLRAAIALCDRLLRVHPIVLVPVPHQWCDYEDGR